MQMKKIWLIRLVNILKVKYLITRIKKANGIAILAHPQKLKLNGNELIEKITELKSYGFDGLECYHSGQTFEQMKRFKKTKKSRSL